jgi:hypothetical protein
LERVRAAAGGRSTYERAKHSDMSAMAPDFRTMRREGIIVLGSEVLMF